MAIKLEFISLIVPIQKIDQYYPGGFNTFIAERITMFGGRLWYDNYLFRDWAMGPDGMEGLIKFWRDRGFLFFASSTGYLPRRIALDDFNPENHANSAFDLIHSGPSTVKAIFPQKYPTISRKNPGPPFSISTTKKMVPSL
jgi:hypothetical protein